MLFLSSDILYGLHETVSKVPDARISSREIINETLCISGTRHTIKSRISNPTISCCWFTNFCRRVCDDHFLQFRAKFHRVRLLSGHVMNLDKSHVEECTHDTTQQASEHWYPSPVIVSSANTKARQNLSVSTSQRFTAVLCLREREGEREREGRGREGGRGEREREQRERERERREGERERDGGWVGGGANDQSTELNQTNRRLVTLK